MTTRGLSVCRVRRNSRSGLGAKWVCFFHVPIPQSPLFSLLEMLLESYHVFVTLEKPEVVERGRVSEHHGPAYSLCLLGLSCLIVSPPRLAYEAGGEQKASLRADDYFSRPFEGIVSISVALYTCVWRHASPGSLI